MGGSRPWVRSRPSTRPRLFWPAVLLLLVGFTASCQGSSESDRSDFCTVGGRVVAGVDSVSRADGLVAPAELRRQMASLRADLEFLGLLPEAAEIDGLDVLTTGAADVDRVLARYGYDRLRAQSESDNLETEDLYSLNSGSASAALEELRSALASCPAP